MPVCEEVAPIVIRAEDTGFGKSPEASLSQLQVVLNLNYSTPLRGGACLRGFRRGDATIVTEPNPDAAVDFNK